MKTFVRITSLALALLMLFSISMIFASALNMEDGTYEVQIALWKDDEDEESMAADAIDSTATIVVKNGVATMHITTHEMKMMGIKASLQELYIADEQGNYTTATVESRNSSGDPTGFYFEMPHANEFIVVKVNPHIAMMGNRDIGARIRIDYSTLTKASINESVTESTTKTVETTTTVTTTKPVESTTETTTEATTIADEASSVTESTTSDLMPEAQVDNTGNPKLIKTVIIAVVIIAVGVVAGIVIYKKKNEEF